MATKIPSKIMRFGLLRQSPDISIATVFKAAGSTASQWTNPAAATEDFRTLYYTKGTPIPDPAVTISDYGATSQKGLNFELSNFHVDGRSGLSRLNFSGLADKFTLAPHLIGALQAVTEGVGSPFTKAITQGNTAGTIDFNSGSGYLHTIAIDGEASADDGIILENAIVDNLTLTWDFIQSGVARLTQISGSWIGNEMNFEQTLNGTWLETTLTPYNLSTSPFAFVTFTVDAVSWTDQCIRRIVLTINNSTASNCATTGGKPNQYDITPEITWNVIFDHNSTTEKLMGDFQAGATVDINFGNAEYVGAGNSDPSLGFDTPFCKILAPPFAYNGDFAGYNLSLRAYQSGTTSPITCELIDTQDWGY